MKTVSLCSVLMISLIAGSANGAILLDLDFNSGVDSLGNSEGDLVFNGFNGFVATLTDDNSDGYHGGNANGVHISNTHHANSKVGSADLVLASFNAWDGIDNYHSSGIVAQFSHGVTLVRLFDADNDGSPKRLFAFDQAGALIAQTAPGSKTTFSLSLADTGNALIWSVEFDTQAGVLGGSADGESFTIDDLYIEGTVEVAPEPGTLSLLVLGGMAIVRRRRK